MTEYKIMFTKIKPYARFDETLETLEKHIIGDDYTDERINNIAEQIKKTINYDYFTIEKRELYENNEKLSAR